MEKDLIYRIALNMLGITFRQFQFLYQSCGGDLGRLFKNASVADHPIFKKLANAAHFLKEAEIEIESIKKEGVRLICHGDLDYPPLLKEISDPPLLLYIKGNFPKTKYYIAIVGTRAATPYGLEVTECLCRALLAYDITIVSGLALGIDRKSHETALVSSGKTIAVVGNGLSVVYPPSNRKLYEEIPLSGAILSEFSMKTAPETFHFPRRNRIISGLCNGIIVIEAPKRSGALITAHLALEQGRDVFSVPGRITSPTSQGTNALIQKGAKLVTAVSDILEELEPSFSKDDLTHRPHFVHSLGIEEEKVLSFLDDSSPFDQLLEQTHLNSEYLSELLLSLELKGVVKRDPADRYYRTYH